MERGFRRLVVFFIALLGEGLAQADPVNLMGFGARASALGQAVTALDLGSASILYNPAALALMPAPELQLGYTRADLGLELNDADAHVLSPGGMTLALGLPFELGSGVVLAPGVGLYFPDPWVLRVQLVPNTEPHYLLLDNDVNRIVINAVAGLKLLPWLSLGAGVTVLGDVTGNGVHFVVGAKSGQRVGQAAVDVSIPTRAAPVLGLLIRPTRWIWLGLSYRGEIALRLRLDVQADVDVAGVVTGDVRIALGATNFYTPERLALGAGFEVTDRLTLSADLVYSRWGGFAGTKSDLQILLNLGVTPALAQATFPQDHLHDTLIPRAAVEYRPSFSPSELTFALRGGLAYEASPIPDQVLLTSFADNDRLVFSGGAGVELPSRLRGILRHPLAFDVSLQYHSLLGRSTRKLDASLPSFSSDGYILSGAATLQIRF